MLRFNTGSKRFRAGSVVGKSLILRWEEISGSSDPRLLLISRLKVRFLPRSPLIINNLQGLSKAGDDYRVRGSEHLCSMTISFPIKKLRLRLSEMCAVILGGVS